MTDLPHGELLTARQLRAAWKPTKEALVNEGRAEGLRIRVHRACGAIGQAESLEAVGEASSNDAALVFRWVALNALYGRWDGERGAPVPDRRALDSFTSEAARVDSSGRLGSTLAELREEARSLLESPFLIERFWSDQEWDRVRPQRGRAAKFGGEVVEKRTGAAMHRLLISVYFLRCQLVHGGATLGSSMNREVVEPGSRVLALATGQLAALVIEHGTEMKWGEVCYPPVRKGAGSDPTSQVGR